MYLKICKKIFSPAKNKSILETKLRNILVPVITQSGQYRIFFFSKKQDQFSSMFFTYCLDNIGKSLNLSWSQFPQL